ncbi:hypothetical protein EAY01_19725, partial [Vibrio anguillarum]|nr:hypothetical protein [Vibrio anguillarum]
INNYHKSDNLTPFSSYIQRVTPESLYRFINSFYLSEDNDKCYTVSDSDKLYALSPHEVYFKFDEHYLDSISLSQLFSSVINLEDDYLFDYILENQIVIEFDNFQTEHLRSMIYEM